MGFTRGSEKDLLAGYLSYKSGSRRVRGKFTLDIGCNMLRTTS